MYHKILLRQLIRQFGSEDHVPAELNSFFQSINSVYEHADEDRSLIERSLEISSRELSDLNLQLKQRHDLIEREVIKRTQELSAEKNKVSLTLASITDAVITLDLDNRIVLFNKAAERLLNKSSQEVIGQKIGEFLHVYENDIEVTPEKYAPSHNDSSEGIVFAGNALKIECGETKAYVNFISSHITDDQRVNRGYIISMHDISTEREFEAMKIDFVSMAAHELRTPLTVVRGYASMLSDEIAQALSEQQKEYMNRMIIGIDNLANLINNLLNVSRIERNSLKLNMSVVDLAEVVQKAIDDLTNAARTKGQHLLFEEQQEHLPEVIADKFRIGEVITNLIGNAIAFTPPDGTIILRLTQSGNFLMVSVSDSGQGIPKEALPKLFSKFFRVSGTLEQGSKGTGLGLYISKSIIDMHKGQIGVASEVGHGSRFYFTLPLATEEEKAVMKTSMPATEGFGIIMNIDRHREMRGEK